MLGFWRYYPREVARMAKKLQASEAGQALSRLGAAKGGEARAAKLTKEQRSDIARKAVQARWAKQKGYAPIVLSPGASVPATGQLPEAKYKGFLSLMDMELPCYVLDNDQRVIGRTA